MLKSCLIRRKCKITFQIKSTARIALDRFNKDEDSIHLISPSNIYKQGNIEDAWKVLAADFYQNKNASISSGILLMYRIGYLNLYKEQLLQLSQF
jgi:hypothetical protein